ncbi:MAG: hypothetical protein ACRDSJ_14610 [Rubrobacteraceae bacterium]
MLKFEIPWGGKFEASGEPGGRRLEWTDEDGKTWHVYQKYHYPENPENAHTLPNGQWVDNDTGEEVKGQYLWHMTEKTEDGWVDVYQDEDGRWNNNGYRYTGDEYYDFSDGEYKPRSEPVWKEWEDENGQELQAYWEEGTGTWQSPYVEDYGERYGLFGLPEDTPDSTIGSGKDYQEHYAKDYSNNPDLADEEPEPPDQGIQEMATGPFSDVSLNPQPLPPEPPEQSVEDMAAMQSLDATLFEANSPGASLDPGRLSNLFSSDDPIEPPADPYPSAEAPAPPIPPAEPTPSPTLEDLEIQEHHAKDYSNIPDLADDPAMATGPDLSDVSLNPQPLPPQPPPDLFDPNASGATLDPALFDPNAPGPTLDPALFDPAAPGPTIDPVLLEQGIVEPSGIAGPVDLTGQAFADPGFAEPHTVDQHVQDQGFENS